ELYRELLKQSRGLQCVQAAQTLRQLGSSPGELAPWLIDLVIDPDYAVSNPATAMLQQFGADGVPAIASALSKSRGDARFRLLGLIPGLGEAAKPLTPNLKEMLKDAQPRNRLAAVRALWALDEDRPGLAKLVVELASGAEASAKNEAVQFTLSIQ